MRESNDEIEHEEEPQEVPEVRFNPPTDCSICGKEGCTHGCFRCGSPVHYDQNYFHDSACGTWILDTWHPGHPQENAFYCNLCLYAGLIEGPVSVGGLTFTYSSHKTLRVTIDGEQSRELNAEETRNLVAFLYDQRGELFRGEE